jgi:hypothetical protein
VDASLCSKKKKKKTLEDQTSKIQREARLLDCLDYPCIIPLEHFSFKGTVCECCVWMCTCVCLCIVTEDFCGSELFLFREEAEELCKTLEENEDKSRTASEMADVLYHAMVLLAVKDVKIEDVMQVLRQRFSQSGIEEKRSRIAES